jgi:hypothetical protein
VLTLAEADAELQRLAILKKNHADEQYLARRSVRDLPETIARLTRRAADLAADKATLAAHAHDPLVLDGRPVAEEDAVKALGRLLDAIPEKTHETRRTPLGVYRGLAFGIAVGPLGARDVYLEGATMRHGQLARDAGPRAVLNALGRLAESYPNQLATSRQDLAIAEGQLRDHQARLGRPFPHEEYLSQLADLRDQLKAGLSQATPEPGLPSVAELAERIKALKAAHTIDAAPERTASRCIAGEEPVTSRIRRRIDLPAAPEPAPEPPMAAPPAPSVPASPEEPVSALTDEPTPLHAAAAPAAARPGAAHRERLIRDRQRARRQLVLF